MFGEYIGRRFDGLVLGALVMMGATSGGRLLSLGDLLPGLMSSFGRSIVGTAPGTLLRVTRLWVRGAALCVAGAVGFVEVVMSGASVTL